jgi:transcriptional regulator with XRE-family HTH domain
MRDLCSSFGFAVRQLREARRWSQEILAEKAGLNRSYVGEVERGRVVPSLVTVEKFAVALGLTGSDLLARGEEIRRAQPLHRFDLASIAC